MDREVPNCGFSTLAGRLEGLHCTDLELALVGQSAKSAPILLSQCSESAMQTHTGFQSFRDATGTCPRHGSQPCCRGRAAHERIFPPIVGPAGVTGWRVKRQCPVVKVRGRRQFFLLRSHPPPSSILPSPPSPPPFPRLVPGSS